MREKEIANFGVVMVAFGSMLAAVLVALLGAPVAPAKAVSAPLSSTIQVTTAAASSPIAPTYWTPPDPAYKISVTADGLYALSYAALQTVGLPVDTIDPRTFRMFWLGREIAIQVEGEEDGRFDPSDAVIFYGRSLDSLYFEGLWPDHKYTGVNIYWLSYGGATGLRMAAKDGTPTGTPAGPYLKKEHREQAVVYRTQYPSYETAPKFHPEDDRWFWFRQQSFGTGFSSRNLTFAADNVATGSYTGTLAVRVVGGSDNTGNPLIPEQHGLRLSVNSAVVFSDTSSWKRLEQFTAVAPISPTLVVSGNNVVNVSIFNVNTSIGENYIDWVEFAYYRNHVATGNQLAFDGPADAGPWLFSLGNFATADIRVYDITDLFQNKLLSSPVVTGTALFTVTFGDAAGGRRYIAATAAGRLAPAGIALATYPASIHTPVDLLSSTNGADWIAITHRDFWTATLPLADYRARSYRVTLLDAQRIYDQFNGGIMSADAIHSFLQYAYDTWRQPRPKFVLLAGGGTDDMRNYLGTSKPTYVPAYLYPSDPILGVTAADNRYVLLANNDLLPDMNIGRFPAFSAAEITTMVNKTITYEATPPFAAWREKVIFVADDLEGGGGNFYEFSNILADGYADPEQTVKYLTSEYTSTKIYMGQTCDLTNSNVAECQADIVDAVNQGALLVSYIGHAQEKNWAVEQMLNQTVAGSFTNGDKLPIFVAMTCYEGFFHKPQNGSRSLAESYLFNPNGGPVASYSPTGFGVATGHDYLEQGLFLAMFHDNAPTLGEAISQSKSYMYANAPQNKYNDLLDTMVLFGDPALRVQYADVPTAVDATTLAAYSAADGVTVSWQTVTEANIMGFNVLRSARRDGEFVRLNAEPIWALQPGASEGAVYSFADTMLQTGAPSWYLLEVLRLDGTTTRLGPVESAAGTNPRTLYLPAIQR
jgi:hypothetical protein